METETEVSQVQVSMSEADKDGIKDKEDQEKVFYKEAFEAFDWNHNGAIPTSVRDRMKKECL